MAIGVILLLTPFFLVPVDPLTAAASAAFLMAVALGVGLWIWRFTLGTVDAAPEETLAYLARTLRATGYVVRVEPRELTVAIGHEALVKLRVEPAHDGSRVLYRADATFLGWIGGVRLPGIYRRVRAWGRDASVTLIPANRRLPAPPSPADAHALLVDALSETHRLAAEAYAAARETYLNSQAILAVAALFVWFLLFLGLSSTSADTDFNRRMAMSAGWALALALGVSLPGSWLIRRFRRSYVARLQTWVNQLQEALRLESGSSRQEDRRESSLELLLKSHAEVPRWLDAARRAGLSVDPVSWWSLFIMIYFGVDLLLWQAPSFAIFSLPLGVILGVAGIAVITGAAVYHERWRRRRNETLARNKAEWDRSYGRLRGEMEQYLGRL